MTDRPPLTPVAEALREPAPDAARAVRLDLTAKVRAALAHYADELAAATVALQQAEHEAAAAQAALRPLETAWMRGAPEPDAPPPPPPPPGHFRLPDGRPWPRLVAARQRTASAETVRRLAAEAVRIAEAQVRFRRDALAQLEREQEDSTP